MSIGYVAFVTHAALNSAKCNHSTELLIFFNDPSMLNLQAKWREITILLNKKFSLFAIVLQ